MIRRPPRSTRVRSSAASDVYKRQVRKLAVILEHFRRRQPPLVAKQLRKITDLPSGGAVAGWLPEHVGLAGRGSGEPEQELDRGRLAGAIGAQKSENFTARHGHREAG